jgi:diguanylate cyclase (GGDEF)-like protein
LQRKRFSIQVNSFNVFRMKKDYANFEVFELRLLRRWSDAVFKQVGPEDFLEMVQSDLSKHLIGCNVEVSNLTEIHREGWVQYPFGAQPGFQGQLLIQHAAGAMPQLDAELLKPMLRFLDGAMTSLAKIKTLKITDPMTGCFNRWYMDAELNRLCNDPTTPSFALMLLDVDHFKHINDTHGHHVGDGCLIELVRILQKEILQGNEALMRLGGDEFMMLFPEIGNRNMRTTAERILRRLSGGLTLSGFGVLQVTVSLGILEHTEDPVHVSKEAVLERVDHAMYTSKKRGRNTYTVWSDSLDQGLNPPDELDDKDPGILRAERDQAQNFAVEVMTAILEAKEYETGLHSVRVTLITELLLEKMNVPCHLRPGILRGAMLHDIGKVAIPDMILHKEGKLTESEMHIMRRHPEIGYRFVASSPFLREAAQVIRSHHEAWDGSGYPQGLKGEDIPLGARIFTLVDVYDSMRANRVYKESISLADVEKEIRAKSGTQFDPSVVEVALQYLDEIEAIGQWQV